MSQKQTVNYGSQVKEAPNVEMLYAVTDKSCKKCHFHDFHLQCDVTRTY